MGLACDHSEDMQDTHETHVPSGTLMLQQYLDLGGHCHGYICLDYIGRDTVASRQGAALPDRTDASISMQCVRANTCLM